jgi:hypothetical protein
MNALLLLGLLLALATAFLLLSSTLRPVILVLLLLLVSDGRSSILSNRFLAAVHRLLGGVVCTLSCVGVSSVHVYNLNYE